MQKLSITDQVQRLDFCRWAADVADNYADVFRNVWFSDESNVLLSAHVCKQNKSERSLHSQKIKVWRAMLLSYRVDWSSAISVPSTERVYPCFT
jgi:hypothetical protein